MESISSFQGRYRFLSNFYPSILRYEGISFPSAEHAFQAAKSIHRGIRREIAALPTPRQAKREGRKLKLRSSWETIKVDVMRDILTEKFSDPDLAALLIKTGDSILIEGNTWGDRFWGACPDDDDDSPRWPTNGEALFGYNHLGKLLMDQRKKLTNKKYVPY